MKNFVNNKLIHLFVIFLLIQTIFVQQNDLSQPVNPENQNPEESQANNRISRSEQIEAEEKLMYKTVEQKVPIDTSFTNFLFTVQGTEDFILNLPIAQQVAFNIFTYEIKNNAYMRPQNIENQAPIRIMVYENNNRLIFQSNFYFQAYIVFQGQEDSTYTIRFINPGSEKLIVMNVKKLTQTTHIEKMVTSTVLSEHASRASQLLEQLKFVTNAFERYSMINLQSVKAVISNVNAFYYWNIIETLMAVFVCIVQVVFISRVCKSESIV